MCRLGYSGYEENTFGGIFFGGKYSVKDCWWKTFGGYFEGNYILEPPVPDFIDITYWSQYPMPYLKSLNSLLFENIANSDSLKHFVFVFVFA